MRIAGKLGVALVAAMLLVLGERAVALQPSDGPFVFSLQPQRLDLPGVLALRQVEDPPDDDDDDLDAVDDDVEADAADPGAVDDDVGSGMDDPGADDPGADDPGADDPGAGDDAGADDGGMGGDDGGMGGGGDDGPGGDDGAGAGGGAGGGDDDGPGGDDGAGAGGGAGGGDDDGPGGDDGPANAGASGATGGGDDDDDGPAANTRTGASGGGGGGGDDDSGGFRLGSARGPQSAGEDRGSSRRAQNLFELGPDEIYDSSGFVARRGQVLVLEPSARTLAEVRRLGYRVAERYRLESAGLTVARLRLPDEVEVDDALAALRKGDPATVFDYEHLYDFSPSGVDDIDRATSGSAQPRSVLSARSDLRIGLIDSAVDPTNPGIAGARIEQRQFVSTGDPPTREHGTAVATILANGRDGLLPRGQYFVASVFHQSTRGESIGAAADLARAIDWLMSRQTPVINMSLAGPPNAVLEAAVRRAMDRGHIVVAAVGNAGPAARPQYPAAYPGVVGVTAVDNSGRVYRRAGRGEHVDFAAPGVAVPAVGGDGVSQAVSGTSFAAPYVAAVLALRHTRPDPVAAQRIVSELAREASDVGDAGQDPVYGYGIVPLRAAAR